jgi:hypothetical protein
LLHEDLKPGGIVGHGTGVIGSLMMLLLLLYSIRKRFRFMRGRGDIGYWLNYHIWLGITGPLLVIFHSAFKLHGIIVISFWSMVGVALSGVFGRFLYLQIPRAESGDDLSGPVLLRIDAMIKNKTAVFDQKFTVRTDRTDRRFVRLVVDILHAMEMDAFPANPGWQCQGCNVKSNCYLGV